MERFACSKLDCSDGCMKCRVCEFYLNKPATKRTEKEGAGTPKIQNQTCLCTSWELAREDRRQGATARQRLKWAEGQVAYGLSAWTVGCLAGSHGQNPARQGSGRGMGPRHPFPDKTRREDTVRKITPSAGLPTVKPASTAPHTKNLLVRTHTSLKSACSQPVSDLHTSRRIPQHGGMQEPTHSPKLQAPFSNRVSVFVRG